MLKRYNDFVFESIINESVIFYSSKFKSLLSKIDSPVAKGLLDIESKDLSVLNNYIDIDKDDKEKISFILDRRAQQILSPENKEKFCFSTGGGFMTHSDANAKIFDSLDYEPTGERTYHPNSYERGEVISQFTSESSGKTYCKVKFDNGISIINKQNLRFDDVSNLPFTQNRQTIRIGRGIRGLLSSAKKTFTDSEIEQFVNKYKSEFDRMNDVFRNFEMVKGSDISKWYNYTTYEQGQNKGPLSTSCMSNVNPSYFDIYVDNPNSCQLLILKTDDGQKIKGRALIWTLIKPTNMIFMDRVYTHADSDIELFRQYAKSKGIYAKYHNSSTANSTVIVPETGMEENVREIVAKVRPGEYDKYPYLDTLKCFNIEEGTLSNIDDDRDCVILEDTGGGHSGREGECEYCGGDGRVTCSDCDGDGEFDCSECNGRGRVDCDECDGSGEVDCDKCDGEGEVDGVECNKCSGKGKVDCDDCDGDGDIECGDCNCSGKEECHSCDGAGRVDCPECG